MRNAVIRMIVFLTLGLCLARSGAQAQEKLTQVDQFVLAERERQKIPGISIAVIEGGKVIKAQGYGFANVEHRVAVTPETIFQSGSMGKQFTSAAVMLLVEDGKISLSDSITKYFPDAPAHFRPITVRHLLTHTSGIPDYTEGTLDFRKDYTEDELLKFAYELKPEFPAGARWNYSNTGYVLLGVLIHKASGQFYGDVLRDRVFAALGMTTARIISEEDIVMNRAAGYRLVKGEVKNQEWVAPKLNTSADGSLYFTARDLIAWDEGLRAHAILKPESWAQIFEPVKLNSGRSYPYGFGWEVKKVNGHLVHRHAGSWQGFETDIVRFPDDGLTVIALTNLAQANPEKFTDGIVEILAPQLAPPELKPIPDKEPAITERLKRLLEEAREGRLKPEEFAYVRAGFFQGAVNHYKDMLRGLAAPEKIVLMNREELGDDRMYRYEVSGTGKAFTVTLGIAPDDKISRLSISPK